MDGEDAGRKPTVTHCAIVSRVLWLNSKFLSRTRGPSASTCIVRQLLYDENDDPETSSYLSTLPEDVTVTLEVVARSSGSETELLSESSVRPLPALHPLPSALTGAVPPRLLTGELTQIPG